MSQIGFGQLPAGIQERAERIARILMEFDINGNPVKPMFIDREAGYFKLKWVLHELTEAERQEIKKVGGVIKVRKSVTSSWFGTKPCEDPAVSVFFAKIEGSK